jgi:hypothetical protein
MAIDEFCGPPDPDVFTDPSPSPTHDVDLASLCSVLHDRGIVCVVVRYAGSGDSGAVEEVEYVPENASVPPWIDDRLRDAAEHYCPDGYENNDGGYGSLTLFPADGLAELEHRDWYVDSEALSVRPARLPKRLRRQLLDLGIVGVTADFDGYGDSGQLEWFQVEPESVVLGAELEAKLEGFLLNRLPGGWEINEGTYGSFTIVLPEGVVTVEPTAAWTRLRSHRQPAGAGGHEWRIPINTHWPACSVGAARWSAT